jgi:hypothetical protein
MSDTSSYFFIENSIENAPTLNSRKNIIAGPRKGDYWFHSPGLEMPDLREEGPFPVQGNIGSLVKQEGLNNFANCTGGPSIGGGPNCTGTFIKDIYTETNTCGENCKMNGPESYGIQNFGIKDGVSTNMHGLHAYKNERAGTEGTGPANIYGCYENVPNLKPSAGNTCELNYNKFESNTVGNFTKLPSWQKFAKYSYN